MKTIPIEVIDGINHPAALLPADALLVVCNGTDYVVYEAGDVLPVLHAEPS